MKIKLALDQDILQHEHIFNLYMIVERFLSNGKKLYCAFVDYAMAFDTVWRQGLWFKLINNGI